MKKIITLLCSLAITVALFTTPAQAGPNPVVIFETSVGRIIVMLNPKEAPKTVANFLKYVDAGFYKGTIFHRIMGEGDFKKLVDGKQAIPFNIVQGGGFTLNFRPKPHIYAPIVNEAAGGMLNKARTIAMARAANPNSATSQFYFNMTDNPPFNYEYGKNPGYCAFGKVIRGWDVVEKIWKSPTGTKGPYKNAPLKPVVVLKAYRAK